MTKHEMWDIITYHNPALAGKGKSVSMTKDNVRKLAEFVWDLAEKDVKRRMSASIPDAVSQLFGGFSTPNS